MKYYLNGAEINALQAAQALRAIAENAGHAPESWKAAWDARRHCEEARELASELSDYALEIIPA